MSPIAAYVSRSDETTRCHFCPNNCARTFIDARTPDGSTSRYISGFSCEKGTVESVDALKKLTAHRKDLRLKYPNLVDYESKVLFRSFYTPEPIPAADALIDSVEVKRTILGGVRKTPVRRPFRRSPDAALEKRRRLARLAELELEDVADLNHDSPPVVSGAKMV